MKYRLYLKSVIHTSLVVGCCNNFRVRSHIIMQFTELYDDGKLTKVNLRKNK